MFVYHHFIKLCLCPFRCARLLIKEASTMRTVQTAPEEERVELPVSLSCESLHRTGCLMTKKKGA